MAQESHPARPSICRRDLPPPAGAGKGCVATRPVPFRNRGPGGWVKGMLQGLAARFHLHRNHIQAEVLTVLDHRGIVSQQSH